MMERWLQRKFEWAELPAVLAEGLLSLYGTGVELTESAFSSDDTTLRVLNGAPSVLGKGGCARLRPSAWAISFGLRLRPSASTIGFGIRLQPPAWTTGYGHRPWHLATTAASGTRLPRLATTTARYSQRLLSSPSAQSPAIQRQLFHIFPWQQA